MRKQYMKRFNVQDFEAIQKIVGKRLIDIFKQLDFYVLNFGEDCLEYSIHTYISPRITHDSKILLTETDEFYNKDYALLSEEEYNKDELHINSLLATTRQKVKKKLKNVKVARVDVSPVADIKILFDNNTCIDIFHNCSALDCEHYSFFKCKDYSFPHYVIHQKKDSLFLETIYINAKK